MKQNYPIAATIIETRDISRQRTVAAAIFAIMLGVFMIYGAGLAQPNLLHNAAHDTRHTLAFPCH